MEVKHELIGAVLVSVVLTALGGYALMHDEPTVVKTSVVPLAPCENIDRTTLISGSGAVIVLDATRDNQFCTLRQTGQDMFKWITVQEAQKMAAAETATSTNK